MPPEESRVRQADFRFGCRSTFAACPWKRMLALLRLHARHSGFLQKVPSRRVVSERGTQLCRRMVDQVGIGASDHDMGTVLAALPEGI